jgi:hypothetical protein
MKALKMSVIASSLATGLQFVAVPAFADPVTLPPANCGLGPLNTCLTFQDFDVYSLPLLSTYQNDKNGIYPLTPFLNPPISGAEPYNLVGVPNEGLVRVVWTSAQGTAAQGSPSAIDDPYDARSGSGPNTNNMQFLMGSALFGGQYSVPSDPGGTFAGDNTLQSKTTVVSTTTYRNQSSAGEINDPSKYTGGCYDNLDGCLPLWDAQISDLNQVLNEPGKTGATPVFFFRNNETGDKSSLDGQDVLAWMRVCLTDTNGAGGTVCFTLGGRTVDGKDGTQIGFGQAQTAGVDDILPKTGADPAEVWAYVHSELCISDGTNGMQQGFPDFPGRVFPGGCNKIGLNGQTLDNNLGQNTATYAMVSNALNAAYLSGTYELLTIDGRLSHLNNGGDLLWIGSTQGVICEPTDPACVPVPEPGSLAMSALGLGLLGIMGWRRQRRTQA